MLSLTVDNTNYNSVLLPVQASRKLHVWFLECMHIWRQKQPASLTMCVIWISEWPFDETVDTNARLSRFALFCSKSSAFWSLLSHQRPENICINMNIRPESLCERMLFTLPHCLTTLSLDDLQVAVSQAEEKRNRGRKREEGGEGTGHTREGMTWSMLNTLREGLGCGLAEGLTSILIFWILN